jgi:hypothetical protein
VVVVIDETCLASKVSIKFPLLPTAFRDTRTTTLQLCILSHSPTTLSILVRFTFLWSRMCLLFFCCFSESDCPAFVSLIVRYWRRACWRARCAQGAFLCSFLLESESRVSGVSFPDELECAAAAGNCALSVLRAWLANSGMHLVHPSSFLTLYTTNELYKPIKLDAMAATTRARTGTSNYLFPDYLPCSLYTLKALRILLASPPPSLFTPHVRPN